MDERINWKRLWKLPDDLKKKVVKGKTPYSKESGEISEWIAIALNRLETHDEMRAISKQISNSTKYKEFNTAISIYLKSNKEIQKKVCNGDIYLLDLINKKSKKLSKEDKKNIDKISKVRDLENHMIDFYKDLKFFLEGSVEDREYLKKHLKPEKIHYLASVLSCIRNEELLKTLIKHQGIKSWEKI